MNETAALLDALAYIENEACRGLDEGDTRAALVDIKFRARAALAQASNPIPTPSPPNRSR